MDVGRPSRTAEQNAFFRALEAQWPPDRRVADDYLARKLIPREFRALTEMAQLPGVHRMIERFIDRRWPCARGGVVARTRLLDDTITGMLPSVEQMLILGAGLDTRAHRLPEVAPLKVFEVDHPATQAEKRRALHNLGPGASPRITSSGAQSRTAATSHPARDALPTGPTTSGTGVGVTERPAASGVTYVPVVFGRDDPQRQLTGAGFPSGLPTLVLWEGTTNYLDAGAVDRTLRWIGQAVAPGSPLLFTYVDAGMLDGTTTFAGAATTMRAVSHVGEPMTFGLHPPEVPGYLAERGFELTEDRTVAEAGAPYFHRTPPPLPAYYHVVQATKS